MTTLFTVFRVTEDVLTDVLTINHSILGNSELIPMALDKDFIASAYSFLLPSPSINLTLSPHKL